MKTMIPMVLLAALAGGLPAAALAQASGDAKNGAQVFYDQGCYGCHGYSGYGRKDLNNTESGMLSNLEVFRAFLRGRGDVAPLLPSTEMPNYPATSVSDAQVNDLFAYIQSMPADLPEAGDIEPFQSILKAAERPYSPQ